MAKHSKHQLPVYTTKNRCLYDDTRILTKLSEIELLLKKNSDHASRQAGKPLTFREACAYLGYAPSYLYKLTYKNIIPHYKPTGKMVFFSKNELDEWIFGPHPGPLPKGEGESGSSTSTASDPNQVEMFEEQDKEKSNEGKKKRRKEERIEKEVVIEFPLKSRRRRGL